MKNKSFKITASAPQSADLDVIRVSSVWTNNLCQQLEVEVGEMWAISRQGLFFSTMQWLW